ncbi:MAG: NUDIX domain-containing protein [Flavobacteriales bacterium]|jgi:ADP-ribose pyrophosphatase YjhB (NUDIX family)|nr:NUDIX domain-containing protein [Flavobacteriales bacterium]
MPRKYDVYIGGRSIRFSDGSIPEQGRRAVALTTKKELHALIDRLISGEEEGDIDVYAEGFDAWQAFCDDHVFVLAAGGVVEDERGRLLAIKRLGKWDLPKGKVEKHEAVEVGAVREVQEECGLNQVELVKPVTSTWHTYERKGKQHLKRTDWFLMRASSKEMLTAQSEEDIEEVRWLDEAGVRMMEADTYPSLLPVLRTWRALR